MRWFHSISRASIFEEEEWKAEEFLYAVYHECVCGHYSEKKKKKKKQLGATTNLCKNFVIKIPE